MKKRKVRLKSEFEHDKPPGLQPTIRQAEAALEDRDGTSADWNTYFGIETGSTGEAYALSHANKHGLYFADVSARELGQQDEDGKGTRVGPLFTIVGTGVEPVKSEQARVIEYRDPFGGIRQTVVPLSIVHQGGHQLAGFLAGKGFEASVSKRARVALQSVLSIVHGPRIQIVGNSGWIVGIDALAFVTPDKIIGDVAGARVVADTDAFKNLKIAKHGTFPGWQGGVAERAVGNSRLQFALSFALASSLLKFAPNVGPTVAQMLGDSSIGKSTALETAGSVWGGAQDDPLGFAHSWNATLNFHLSNAAAHSGTGLCLDEFHLAQDGLRVPTPSRAAKGADG